MCVLKCVCVCVKIWPNHLYYISIIYYVLTKFLPLGACLKTHIASISHQISRVLSYNLTKGSVNKNYRSFLCFFVCLCVRKEKKRIYRYQIKFLQREQNNNTKIANKLELLVVRFYGEGHGTYYVDIIMLRHASRTLKWQKSTV